MKRKALTFYFLHVEDHVVYIYNGQYLEKIESQISVEQYL